MRLTMPASTLPGPHFDHVGDASGLEGLHAFDPAHRAESLAVQGIGEWPPASCTTATSMLLITWI